MDKDAAKVVKALRKQGFEVTIAKNGHAKVRTSDGVFVTVIGGTVSDWRGLRNSIAVARRFGFRWPPKS